MSMKEEKEDQQKPLLGYAFCGGGARGFAHLGAMKALEEYGLKPDIIAGTSAGALAGVLYADGYSPEDISELFKAQAFTKLAKPTIGASGLLKTKGLMDFLKSTLRAKRFEELQVPFVAVATNWETPGIATFSSGEHLVRSVVASCTVPIAFEPITIDGVQYVDGGVMKNFPVSAIRKECECIVGINLSLIQTYDKAKSIRQAASRYFDISSKLNVIHDREICDVLVDVEGLHHYRFFDLNHIDEIAALGYEATKAVLAQQEVQERLEPYVSATADNAL